MAVVVVSIVYSRRADEVKVLRAQVEQYEAEFRAVVPSLHQAPPAAPPAASPPGQRRR